MGQTASAKDPKRSGRRSKMINQMRKIECQKFSEQAGHFGASGLANSSFSANPEFTPDSSSNSFPHRAQRIGRYMPPGGDQFRLANKNATARTTSELIWSSMSIGRATPITRRMMATMRMATPIPSTTFDCVFQFKAQGVSWSFVDSLTRCLALLFGQRFPISFGLEPGAFNDSREHREDCGG